MESICKYLRIGSTRNYW